MQVRKIVVSTVMMGAFGAAGLGLAGTASATGSCHYNCPKPSSQTTTVTKTKTTTVQNNGQVGNGNTQQTASNNAGQINNPQIGLGTNLGLQVPINAGVGLAGATGRRSDADATGVDAGNVKQSQSATGNVSDNTTKVNNANGNGNDSSVSIG